MTDYPKGPGTEYSELRCYGDRVQAENEDANLRKDISIEEDSQLYLVGFRVDADNEIDCDFYTLYIDDERAIDYEGFPIIFFDIQMARKALEMSTCACQGLELPPPEVYAFMDIADAIYAIAEKDVSPDSNILDCLNILLDFLTFLPNGRIHQQYMNTMREAANYFTFSLDIKTYFEEHRIDRLELIQAIEWSVGATVLYAKYVY